MGVVVKFKFNVAGLKETSFLDFRLLGGQVCEGFRFQLPAVRLGVADWQDAS